MEIKPLPMSEQLLARKYLYDLKMYADNPLLYVGYDFAKEPTDTCFVRSELRPAPFNKKLLLTL